MSEKQVDLAKIQIPIATAALILVSLVSGYAVYTKTVSAIREDMLTIRTERAERAQNYMKKDEVQVELNKLTASITAVEDKVDLVNQRTARIEGYLKRGQFGARGPSLWQAPAYISRR